MLVSETVEEYTGSLVNKSRHTRPTYSTALKLFASWCQDHGVELETIKVANIRRYTEWLQVTRGLSMNSVNSHIITIKTFLRWCQKEDAGQNPGFFMQAKRTHTGHPLLEAFS